MAHTAFPSLSATSHSYGCVIVVTPLFAIFPAKSLIVSVDIDLKGFRMPLHPHEIAYLYWGRLGLRVRPEIGETTQVAESRSPGPLQESWLLV